MFVLSEGHVDDSWDVTVNILSGAGYVVVKSSVDLGPGVPDGAWTKSVTAAANTLIALGVADSTRLGVQGTGDAGYATTVLLTQTTRFKAAINISGAVDMISFYTDSPRLGAHNVAAAEHPQGRVGGTLWARPEDFAQRSPILFANRITTPLMLITGGQDATVPPDNTSEMFYALRRLGKEVVLADYRNGGHGGGTASPDDFLDLYRRMVGWYDDRLKRKRVP